MKGWKEVNIKSISSRITSGGTPSTKCPEYYGGNIPWLNTKEVNFRVIESTENYITELGLGNSSAKWIEANSIIVAMYGATAGKCALTKIPLTTNQACCNITIDQKIADYKYIYYTLVDSYSELENMATGAAQQNLNAGMIAEFSLLLPPLPEQKAIAAVLSSLDDKIDLLHRQNKTLEAMAETLFRQWFVEEADEGWEEGKLGNLMILSNGKSRPNTVGLIPVYGGNGVLSYTDRSNYEGESIIIGRVGAYCGSIFFENNEIWVSDNALHAKAKSSEENYFLFYLLRILELNSLAEGSSHPLLTQTLLNSIDIIIPDRGKRIEFNTIVKHFHSKIFANNSNIKLLEKLRDTLLPKLMSGEVRVKV